MLCDVFLKNTQTCVNERIISKRFSLTHYQFSLEKNNYRKENRFLTGSFIGNVDIFFPFGNHSNTLHNFLNVIIRLSSCQLEKKHMSKRAENNTMGQT